MSANLPAILGGVAAFPDGAPLCRPRIDDDAAILERISKVLRSGQLTNSTTVRELEAYVADRLQVPHVVAVSSCTAGLMLVYQALSATGRVVLPSFTFAASAHAVVWAGGTPDFVDIDPLRLTVDPDRVAEAIDGAAAISATHLYGAPAEVERLQDIADAAGVPLVYDAAHGLGSHRRGRSVGGFGTAEVFSLSPTKVAFGGEGGLVATHDPELAHQITLGRDYGNPGDYNCSFPGLNARMSELHAAVALSSIASVDEHVRRRNELVAQFRTATAGIAGLTFQQVDDADLSTYKDLTLILDESRYGLTAAEVATALGAERIDTRRYYSPPIHRQKAYASLPQSRPLPITDRICEQVITVPLWSQMADAEISRVADAIERLHVHAAEIRKQLR